MRDALAAADRLLSAAWDPWGKLAAHADELSASDVYTLRRIVPEDMSLYRHNDEGPDDMPAHIKSALTQTELTIPITAGRLQLGVWQGIFLFEHRASPHQRSLVLTLIGEEDETASSG